MKSASQVFYTIGFVFVILGLIFETLFLIVAAIGIGNPEVIAKVAQETGYGVALIKDALMMATILLAVSVAINIAVLVLTIIAKKDLKDNNGKLSTHIILLIGGIFAINFFYLLGGIFGVTAANEDANA